MIYLVAFVGWCLCFWLLVLAMVYGSRAGRYARAIRTHRDYRGDDRCYLDDRELYAVLPEGYTPPPFDTAVTLPQCERFISRRQDPATEYVSPQRRIEELEALTRSQAERIAGLAEIVAARAETPDGKRIAELEAQIQALQAQCLYLTQTRGGLYW